MLKCDPVALPQAPRSMLLRALDVLGLDPVTAGHGLALFSLLALTALLTSTVPINSGLGALLFLGLIATQICLATVWATWSTEPLLVRGGRLLWQMLALYLLLLVMDCIWGRRHTVMLGYQALTMAPFLLLAWLPAWVLRWFRWRLVNIARLQEPVRRRMQFHLADAWRWSTLLCVLLAVMTLFRNELTGWDGLGYAILVYLGWTSAAPVGLVVSLLFWLALTQRWTLPRKIVAAMLVVAWLVVSGIAAWYAIDTRSDDGGVWGGIWILADVVCVVTLLTAAALRRRGWRMVR